MNEEHKRRHVMLHKLLDELVADFITQVDECRLSETPIMELMNWSYKQTKDPDHDNVKE